LKEFLTSATKDIRFWLAFFFLVRLCGITNPPLDGNHHWRQVLTASIARNFYELEPGILYPHIDYAFGEHHGLIASEFPLFSWLISAVSRIVGYDHWYGRLINLIVSTVGLWFFYRVLKLFFSERHAFYSTFFLTISVWFAFARKVMPDTFSMSLMIIGFYYAVLYVREGKWWQVFLFFLLASTGGLCKLPVAFALVFPGIFVLDAKLGWQRRLVLLATCAASALVICWWYFVWIPELISRGGHSLYFIKSLGEGFSELLQHKGELVRRFLFDNTKSYLLTAVAIAGCFMLLRADKRWRIALLASLPLILFFMLKTGEVFALHNYYQIPLVPLTCVAAGFFIIKIPVKWGWIIGVVVLAESMINQIGDLSYPHRRAYKIQLEEIMNRFTSPNDMIAVVGDLNPVDLYFAHRRGWIVDQHEVTEERITDLRSKNCQLLLLPKRHFHVELGLKVLYEDENFAVYELKVEE